MAREKNDIEKYNEGSLPDSERHAIEKKSLEDPFLSDALEGSGGIPPKEFASDLDDLQKKIQHRSRRSWFTPLRIAAGVIMLVGAVATLYLFKPQDEFGVASESSEEFGPVKPGDEMIRSTPMAGAQGPIRDSTQLALAKPEQSVAGEATKNKTKIDPAPVIAKNQPITQEKTDPVNEPISKTADKKTEIAELKTDDLAADKDIKEEEKVPTLAQSQTGAGLARKDARSLAAIARNITGRVTFEDGTPVPGANVVVKGTNKGTVTDIKGNFILPVADEKQAIAVSFIGMKTSEIIPEGKTSLEFKLAETSSSLNEVVVEGKLIDDPNHIPVIKTASPVGGIRAYNKYLEDNLHYPVQALAENIKGKVTIQFTIQTDGVLSEFTVLRGIGHGCDEEVIRLVKEGPKWTPTTEDDKPVETEVKVKMKFDPDKVRK